MALTPEDVVTKQFQHVRFKEGFDPDEVDDFLDEIVVEWRKTIAENDELKAKLATYESGETAPVAAAPADVVDDAPVAVAAPIEAAPVESAPVESAPAETAPATDAVPAVSQSAGIIELAQRLHDEHVAEGQATRDKLVSEAEAKRDKLVSDAESKAAKIVGDAETKSKEELSRLERESASLESRISELREFERDYRGQLRSFIENKLSDLDVTGTGAGSAPVQAGA